MKRYFLYNITTIHPPELGSHLPKTFILNTSYSAKLALKIGIAQNKTELHGIRILLGHLGVLA